MLKMCRRTVDNVILQYILLFVNRLSTYSYNFTKDIDNVDLMSYNMYVDMCRITNKGV